MKLANQIPKGMFPLLLAGMAAMAATMGIGRFASTPFQPALRSGLGLSLSEAGFIATANYLGYLVGAIITARPSFPLAGRRLLLVGMGFNALGLGLMTITSHSLAILSLIRFEAGIASAFTMIAGSSLVVASLQRWQRESWLGWHFGGIGFGIILSSLLAELITLWGGHWRLMWGSALLLSLFACLIAWWGSGYYRWVPSLPPPEVALNKSAQADSPSKQDNHTTPSISASVLKKDGYFLVYGYGFFALGYVVTATFLADQLKSNPETASFANYGWMATGIGGMASTALLVKLSQKFGYTLTMGMSGLITGLAVFLTVVSHSVPILMLAACLFGLFFIGVVALGLRSAQRLAALELGAQSANKLATSPSNAKLDPLAFGRQAMAKLTIAFGLGQMVGPWIGGWLVDKTGSFTLSCSAAALALGLSGLAMGWGCRHVH